MKNKDEDKDIKESEDEKQFTDSYEPYRGYFGDQDKKNPPINWMRKLFSKKKK